MYLTLLVHLSSGRGRSLHARPDAGRRHAGHVWSAAIGHEYEPISVPIWTRLRQEVSKDVPSSIYFIFFLLWGDLLSTPCMLDR